MEMELFSKRKKVPVTFDCLCQSGYVDIVEKSLNRHDNHRGMCGPASRNMPVSILNS